MMKKGAAYVLIFTAARPCTFARQCLLFKREETLRPYRSAWLRRPPALAEPIVERAHAERRSECGPRLRRPLGERSKAQPIAHTSRVS